MPAPSLVHFFRGEQTVDRSVYPDLDDVLVGSDRHLP